jgi:hypothetical protein
MGAFIPRVSLGRQQSYGDLSPVRGEWQGPTCRNTPDREAAGPFYSIMGSMGDGRSDGYVSVQSAHLEGAQSELTLPVGHRAFDQAAVLNEIYRILAWMDGYECNLTRCV